MLTLQSFQQGEKKETRETGDAKDPYIFFYNHIIQVFDSFGAVFLGTVLGGPPPRPLRAVIATQTGQLRASMGAISGAVLGPARPAGSSSRGPKSDIDCDNPDMANF